MKWEEYQFVLSNKHLFRYNDATMGGSDSSVDPTASGVNPSAYLAPDVGTRKIRSMLMIAVLVLGIIYLFKHI